MLIGLTGNFGSGKSTVLKLFASLGAITPSADEIVQGLLKTAEIKGKIAARFGSVLDAGGELDKKKVAAIAFADENMRRFLESLLHPLVICEITAIGAQHKHEIVVAEIPLLFEGGFQNRVDKVVTVVANREVVFKRLGLRGFSEEEVKSRLASQIPDDIKARQSDYVLDNSGKPDLLESEVRKLYEKVSATLAKVSATPR
ncbi:MAG: dephospho-CoA kinase [Nitrospirae bacterium]|nr:dephospho-CoA kinase [Nitrospirota bacterium]